MTTYLVTGANRGLGLGFVKQIAANPKNIVIGTARNEAKAKPIFDLNLPNVKVLYTDMQHSEKEFVEDFKVLKDLAPNGIDVLIHGAAISPGNPFDPTVEHEVDTYYQAFDVNVGGTIKLYKAIYPHLIEDKSKLVFISSVAGTNGDPFMASAAYGVSKAAFNHVVRQIAFETKFTTIAVHPGLVETDMSKDIRESGVLEGVIPVVTVEQSSSSLLSIVDKLSKDDNGKFYSYTGEQVPW